MVTAAPALEQPWLAGTLQALLAHQRAHALLLHGPAGVGQFELSLALAQAWLCEADTSEPRPCGHCASCRLVQAHSHPDLLVLLPEVLQAVLGWGPGGEESEASDRASKAKPSKEIKIDAVRAAIQFAQTTGARGRGKVVVLFPAEALNGVSANALLKTLEEPPGAARFVLGCTAPDQLLPTIRSRCQSVAMTLPDTTLAEAWLAGQGVKDAGVLLAAAGGQPQLALDWAGEGIDAALWRDLPKRISRGDASSLSGWPVPRVVDALQKLCHDTAAIGVGGRPRYFPAASLGSGADLTALTSWMAELNRMARHADHPLNAGLVIESLVQGGQQALSATSAKGRPRKDSVHSGA